MVPPPRSSANLNLFAGAGVSVGHVNNLATHRDGEQEPTRLERDAERNAELELTRQRLQRELRAAAALAAAPGP